MDLKILEKTENRFELANTEEAALVDKINDSLFWGATKYAKENGFMYVEVPIMTKITGACENVDTLYALDHFGKQGYLAQTGQLYLESKIPLHKKLWTMITSSRAEDTADNRHLNQFQLFELEFRGGMEDLIYHIEGTVKSMLSSVYEHNKDELEAIGRTEEIKKWIDEPFARITYTQAVEEINKLPGFNFKWGDDLKQVHETNLSRIVGKPMFITHYPEDIKFFNMKVNEFNPKVVNSTDLIMPYSGESVGAAERENNYNVLVERLENSQMYKILKERGHTLDDFKDYLSMVKKHPILHSGCGIGMSRISQSVLGQKDIRTATSYPLQSNVLY